jgi:tetratricopeptide (TPR) repeat protein
MILYRPVGLQELELIYDSGMKAFPARLPEQPIFYPVLQLEYARQVASDWNVKSGQLAGYVTQFKMEDQYISQFEEHTVGSSQHQELWIPAEELEKFNQHIIGRIKVLEAHFGEAFQGYVPETFGLQGKDAVAQFTLLANSYIYKRMDFYLEIRRNHKAIFLNYPFWQTYDFKNSGLKEKIIKAIKEAWLTSFPQIPLVNPVPENVTPVKPTDPYSLADPVHEEPTPVKSADSHSRMRPLDEDVPPVKRPDSRPWVRPVQKDIPPVKPTEPTSRVDSLDEDVRPVERTHSHDRVEPVDEDVTYLKQSYPPVHAPRLVNPENPFHEDISPRRQTVSHFSQGLDLGLSGKIHEAIDELSKAIQDDPDHVVAQTSLGVAFHRAGDDDRALSCYEAALKIDPNDAEAHYFRANILYSHGNVREAIAGYTIAIGLEPELIEAHQKPAPQDQLTDYSPTPAEMVWIAKPAHRILNLNKSLETNPRQANLFKERAAQYYRLWNYEQTIVDYSSALALQPDDASALHSRGSAYEQLRQFDRALEDYQKAIVINPQLSDVYINRGVTFGKMGNLRQSIASLTEGIRLAPRNPDGYFNRGTSYFQLGELERAVDDFSMVIELSPNDDAAYYWRGISKEEAGRPREAIVDYRQFLALSRDENARAEIEQRLNHWNEGDRNGVSSRRRVPDDRQKTNRGQSGGPDQDPDLYGLIAALGERALHSIWFSSGVECYGDKAEELYAVTDQNRPIEGGDFLRIASGIRQTIRGDFQAFDPGAAAHWIFIRAWDGSGFYMETDDPKIEQQLKAHFQALEEVEEVEGANPPYQGLFLRL